MNRPRVVIVDADENYILPLQQKFAEKYYETIDLEIITDTAYFGEFFSSPQKIDLLIISEPLYSLELQRHDLTLVFVMTEQLEEAKTTEVDLTVNRLFKYSSIQDIFNSIVARSEGLLQAGAASQKDCQLVLLYSAAGGTGKTTVALGLCGCLANNQKRVLYINAGYLQNFQRMLQDKRPILEPEVYAALALPDGRSYTAVGAVVRREAFSYLPPFKAPLVSLGLPYSIYADIAGSAKASGLYDYVVVDADSAFDEEKARLLNMADRVLVVTGGDSASMYATNILAGSINGVTSDKFVFVCNNLDSGHTPALDPVQFTLNGYVAHHSNYDRIGFSELALDEGIQKIAYLLL